MMDFFLMFKTLPYCLFLLSLLPPQLVWVFFYWAISKLQPMLLSLVFVGRSPLKLIS